jgi:hypothetical protein
VDVQEEPMMGLPTKPKKQPQVVHVDPKYASAGTYDDEEEEGGGGDGRAGGWEGKKSGPGVYFGNW